MVEFITFLVLLTVGYFVGRRNESKHFQDLALRERAIRIPVRGDARGTKADSSGSLVVGSAVVAQDYFKATLSSLQNIVGGNVRAYESLMDRARREAMLRMMERAQALGADEVVNLRVETFPITKGGAVEVCVYGTGVRHALHP